MTATVAYQYVVLRCVPRVDREEFVNVGVVLYCRATDFLEVAWRVDPRAAGRVRTRLDLDQVCGRSASSRVCAGDERGERPGRSRSASASGFLKAPAARCSSPDRCTVASPATRRQLRHLVEKLVG